MRGTTGWRRPCAALTALVLSAGAAQAQAVPPRNLLVRVQAAPEGAPLGYSVVAIRSLGVERFTGAGGVVVIPVPTPGPVRLTVKRLGFAPRDTVITVTDAPSQEVTIALARVSFRLEAVRVVAWPPCRRPGLRSATADVRGIVEQLRQNAERYRLLTRSYPFSYTLQRQFGHRTARDSLVIESQDVIRVSGTPEWTYRPGTLVAREAGGTQWEMRIPSLSDLAEDAFVQNHCFHVAGLEEKEGLRLLRLDIVAAERLRGVDVNVVVWLAPEEYQLRHATFTLTRPPRQVRGLQASTSAVRYREVIPFVPVLELLVAENRVEAGRDRRSTQVQVERQALLDIIYHAARPDSLLGGPPARAR